MAGSISNAGELVCLDALLGNGSPATVYIAAYTVAPSDSGGGTECSLGSYARIAVTNNSTNWPAAADGSKSNGVQFDFPTATGAVGTIVAWGVHSHITNDALLVWADVDTEKTIADGDDYYVPVGGITVTLD